jgi:C4-dicarboxylate-specific signal transduction histidine kinase
MRAARALLQAAESGVHAPVAGRSSSDGFEETRLTTIVMPTITIETALVEGDRVRVLIADNGRGIDEEVRSKLFDPFFTTKPVGQGTGLGLSISYQIVVDKHRGTLDCREAPTGGTEFLIEIPIEQPEWNEST